MQRPHSLHPSRWLAATGALLACACVGQATRLPDSAENPASAGAVATLSRTVFTDTALFRERCIEADSGLSMRTGRCTPRDQPAVFRKP
jgi:hypothetical protein